MNVLHMIGIGIKSEKFISTIIYTDGKDIGVLQRGLSKTITAVKCR